MPKIYWSEQNFTAPTKKSEKRDQMEPKYIVYVTGDLKNQAFCRMTVILGNL
jgi:hypothetical protein